MKVNLVKTDGIEIENVYQEMFFKVLHLKKTLFSFKDKEGNLYFKEGNNSNNNLWKKTSFDVATSKIIEEEQEEFTFIEIFTKFLNDTELYKDILPITFSELNKKIEEQFSSFIKKDLNHFLIFTLLFYVFIQKNGEININSDSLTTKDLKILADFSDLDSKDYSKFFSNCFEIKNLNIEKCIQNILCKQDKKNINKLNLFFDKKVKLPGKYLIKHFELLLEGMVKEFI